MTEAQRTPEELFTLTKRLEAKRLEATVAAERRALEAAKRLRAAMHPDHIAIARQARKEVRGSGHSWWFTHARAVDFADAFDALEKEREDRG